MMHRLLRLGFLVTAAALAGPALGQLTAAHRTTLQEHAFPAPLRAVTVLSTYVVEPSKPLVAPAAP